MLVLSASAIRASWTTPDRMNGNLERVLSLLNQERLYTRRLYQELFQQCNNRGKLARRRACACH
uniref:CULLIN_2 domain-containing protein n=1 Tax=Macrostomum lignano TaxID=282301 RepID=A0A1I8I2D0_9PLAT